MSADNRHSEQFEKYLRGEMTDQEAYDFESKYLDDSFTQEALEGYEEFDVKPLSDLPNLRKKVAQKKFKSTPIYRYASAAVLLLVGTLAIYFITTATEKLSENNISQRQELLNDSTSVSKSENAEKVNNAAEKSYEIDKEEQDTIAEKIEARPKTELVAEATTPQKNIRKQQKKVITKPEKKVDLAENNPPKEIETLAEADEISTPAMSQNDEVAEAKSTSDFQSMQLAQTSSVQKSTDNAIKLRGQTTLNSIARNKEEGGVVSGVVTDMNGDPLPGVNVVVKGTTAGVTTDLDGAYTMPKFKDMALIYSYVGFESQEILVEERNQIDVSLGGAQALQEVVVVGYGKAEKIADSKAIPTVGMEAYQNYLQDSLRYPKEALDKEIEGSVKLKIAISGSGEIKIDKVLKSLSPACDEEAKRLILEGPKWKAAQKDGNNIESTEKIKVNFKISDN